MRILTKHNKLIMIETNGQLIEKRLSVILDSSVEILIISIDSHLPALNDHMRGKQGYFKNAMRAIQLLKNSRKQKKPLIYVKAVITKSNYQYLEEYVDFFKDKVDQISFQPVRGAKQYEFNNQDIKKLKTILNCLKKKHADFSHPYYQLMPDFLVCSQRMISQGKFHCYFYSTFALNIQADGEIWLCPFLEIPKQVIAKKSLMKLGNIKNNNINKIITNQKSQLIQKYLKSKHIRCSCWYCGHMVNVGLSNFL